MSHRILLVRAIKDSLSVDALDYFVNTTEQNEWVDLADQKGLDHAIAEIESYAEWFCHGGDQDA